MSSVSFESPHWLSDEQIEELGVPKCDYELYRRYYYQQAFSVSAWYDRMPEHTFATKFVSLDEKEVKAILNVHHSLVKRNSTLLNIDSEKELMEQIQVQEEDTIILNGLEERLEEAITSFGDTGAFIKLNTRSPKDVCINATNDYQRVSSLMKLFEGFLAESRGGNRENLKGQFTVDEVMSAFVRACTKSMRVTTASDAIDLLLESNRVQQDLTRVETFGLKNIKACVVVRQWNENIVKRNHMEFRGFVYKNQLNALTQYDELTYYDDIVEYKEEIGQRVLDFFNNEIRDKLKDIESYVIDFFVDEDKVYVIELNPFHNGAGAGLFSWREHRNLFMNGPFEFRVLEESAKDPLYYLSTVWERKLKEYTIPIPQKEESSKSDEEIEDNDFDSKPILMIAGAVTIAIIAIGGYFYFKKEN